jgi:gamma-glutamyl hercynylcysteine S-oxide synthase
MLTTPASALRLDLLTRYSDSRRETDRLFSILVPAALYDRPIPERHRIVFYIGHLEAFDWNLLRDHLELARFHSEFDNLFAFGIDPVDGGLPNDKPGDWPSIDQVETYRNRIRHELDAALGGAAESEELVQLMNIAIEHRLMHAETLEYMFHQLPYETKVTPELQRPTSLASVTPEMIQIPAGVATLGLKRGFGQFGWDNEFQAQTVEVPTFSIDKYKVTNGQFAKFVEGGGYSRRSLWSQEDWDWKSSSEVSHPVFWVKIDDRFHYRGMFEEIPLALDSPVYVSHAEASAYARWVGKALPTEAEWHRAAYGAQAPQDTRKLWDPPPVGSFPELSSAFGIEGLFGTAWEWTSTTFAPFPGFQITPAYPGYSANFFDGKHFVMKGGSTRTAACMLRNSFRNWFQAHYQYVYAGFRCTA